MAQSGFTPIITYNSGTTTTVPTAGNLANGELALNYADGKLFYKDSGGVVQVLASKSGNVNVSSFSAGTTGFTPSTATTGAVTLAGTLATTNGGTGLTSFTANGVVYASSTSALATGSALTFDGTNLILGSANPLFQGSSSTGSASLSNNSAGAYVRVYGGSHATRANFTDFINASSTSTFDSSGNLGLGVTPSAWASRTVLEVGSAGNAFVSGGAGDVYVTEGCYYNAGWKYGNSLYAPALYNQYRGTHTWNTAASGTAGNAISFTQAMTLGSNGFLGIGQTSPAYPLDISTGANAAQIAFQSTISSGTNFKIAQGIQGVTNSGMQIYDLTNSAVRLAIDGSGNLAVGTTNTTYGKVNVKATGSQIYSGLTLFSNDGTESFMGLGCTGSVAGISVTYGASGSYLPFVVSTGGTERMRLDTSGNLDLTTAGAVFTTNRGAYNQQTKFYQDTSGFGAQYETTNPSVNAGYYPHIFKGTNNVPTTIEYGRFNQFGLGLGGTNPTSGTGITFPATQSASSNANTLDDYEEGDITGLTDGSGAGLSITFTNPKYTKIGRLVYVSIDVITYPITASTAAASITGLPFTNAVANVASSALVANNANANRALVVGASTSIFFYATTTTGQSLNSQLSGAVIYGFSAVYQTS
jgi:hypothetical protein